MRLPWGINVKHLYLAFFSLISIALCAFSITIYSQYTRERTFDTYAAEQYEAMRRTRAALMDAVDMESGVRGYALTGNAVFLEPYDRGRARLNDDFAAIGPIPDSLAGPAGEPPAWSARIRDLQATLDDEVAAIRAHGRAAVSPADLDRQKTEMDAVRTELQGSIDSRMRQLTSRAAEDAHQKNTFLYILVFGTVLGIAILLAGTLVIIRLEDVNERAEKERQHAEARFMTVLSGINDGLYEVNLANGNMYMSNEFRAMLGYGDGDMAGTEAAALDAIHPEDRASMLEVRRQYVSGETPAYRNVFRMKHRDGGWRWILSRGIGRRDDAGHIRSIIGTHTDVTEQRSREEEVRQLHADMEAFTYITSHDMRSPLVNLKGFSHELKLGVDEVTELLEPHRKTLGAETWTRLEAVLKADIPEALGFIGNAVDRMDTLTSAILDLSRIGRYTYREEPVNARAIFDKCLGAQSYEIGSKGVTVEIGTLPDIVTDPLALEQIFSNLLDNAVKYLRPDTPGRIEVDGRDNGRDIVFSIRDNGRGIDPGDHDRVFNIFRRARNTGDVRGMGLGMAFVKATLRRLSGRIWFESVPDEGTVFFVSLPRKVPEPAAEASEP